MRFHCNNKTYDYTPAGPIPAVIEKGEVWLVFDDSKIRATDVKLFTDFHINDMEYTKLQGTPMVHWDQNGFYFLHNEEKLYLTSLGYIQTTKPLYCLFVYKDELREGEIYPSQSIPRWGIRYGAFWDNGLFLKQADQEVQLPCIPMGAYEQGPIPVIYYKGEWSLEVAPKTFKLDKISELQISTSPIAAEQHRLYKPKDSQRPEGTST